MAYKVKKAENSWTRYETEFLISVYEKYPLLYNSKYADYFKSNKRESALNEITAEVANVKPGVTANCIRTKIKTLRNQLTVEKKNYAKTSKMGMNYVPKLWCYNQLGFLQHTNDDRDGSPNVNDLLQESPVASDDNEVSSEMEKMEKLYENAGKSLDLVRIIAENSEQQRKPPSKQMLFCNYLCSELEELEETYDEVKQLIMDLVMKAKLIEKQNKQNRNPHQYSSVRTVQSMPLPSTPPICLDESLDEGNQTKPFVINEAHARSPNSSLLEPCGIKKIQLMKNPLSLKEGILKRSMEVFILPNEN